MLSTFASLMLSWMFTSAGGIPNIKFSAALINSNVDQLCLNKNIYLTHCKKKSNCWFFSDKNSLIWLLLLLLFNPYFRGSLKKKNIYERNCRNARDVFNSRDIKPLTFDYSEIHRK